MQSIDGIQEALYEINKSKFFSYAYPIFDTARVDEILKNLHEKYKDATHICYAYVLDIPKVEKANDDGEPSGTAGKPLLELLKKKKISNTLIAVIRYFGGIKLGAGGLVRAYTNAGNMALDKAKIVDFINVNKYLAKINHADGAKLKMAIISHGGEVLTERYEEKYIIEFTGEIAGLNEIFKDIELKLIGSELRCH